MARRSPVAMPGDLNLGSSAATVLQREQFMAFGRAQGKMIRAYLVGFADWSGWVSGAS